MSECKWPQIVAHRERLLRIARRRCPTREDAEDVVSEAMLRCATFEGLDEERLEQFLTAVTVRLCADLYRKAERRARAVVKLASDPDVTPGPEDELLGGVDPLVLKQLLASLPARQRAVLFDRARGLSVKQIARRHALSYKAAESALARARGAMRAALAAASSVLVAFRAAWRPRRAAVLALPVATLTLAGTVLRLPLLDDDQAQGRPRAASSLGATQPAASEDRRAAAVASRGGASRPATATERAPVRRPAERVPPPDDTQEIVIGDDPSLTQTRVKHKPRDPQTTQEYLASCVTEGAHVDVTLRPGDIGGRPGGKPVSATQGCG